jgi:hypothetical protein
MNILYLGTDSLGSTARHRADAIRRIGHSVEHQNPQEACSLELSHPILSRIHYRTGYRLLSGRVTSWVKKILSDNEGYDLVWIDGGELFGPDAIKLIKKKIPCCILFNVDDPMGPRDGARFAQTRKAIPDYTLCVTPRKVTEIEIRERGCPQVLRVYFSYDELAHAPFEDPAQIPDQFKSDVAFIGTWMRHEGRDKFLLQLIKAGIPVAIWGARWQKSRHWNRLRDHWRGSELIGRDYVSAIQGAKICLGMLSKGNRDLHTQRSLEIPYAGGLLCAERTSEHLELYREGVEAAFWSSPEECIARCKELLSDDSLRESIRLAGIKRVRELKVGNEDICRQVLDYLDTYDS